MSGKRILICPLNWGLGHATRDVEVINQFVKSGFDVVMGADKAPLLFLKEQFPDLEHIVIPSVNIKYHKKGIMALKMLFSVPKLLWGIYREHRLLNKLVQKHQIDIVISDNRYGLWSKKAKCIFITHQLWIKSPKQLRYAESLINYINHWFIEKYDECWVPDFEGNENLAGELSHPKKKHGNVKYIGILSRFKDLLGETNPDIFSKKFDILVILSGPEPQRTILEKLLVKQISSTNYKTLIVQGKPEQKFNSNSENIEFINHLSSLDLKTLINDTPVIICRSGYSSIMDLVVLNKSAILIPTPGQTEQEYLAQYLSKKNWFCKAEQHRFDLEKAIIELDKIKISYRK